MEDEYSGPDGTEMVRGGPQWGELREEMTELERDALKTGFPSRGDIQDRMEFITRIKRGRSELFARGIVFFKVMEAVRAGKRIDWTDINPVQTLMKTNVSLAGAGRREIVDIAQWFPKEEPKGLLRR